MTNLPSTPPLARTLHFLKYSVNVVVVVPVAGRLFRTRKTADISEYSELGFWLQTQAYQNVPVRISYSWTSFPPVASMIFVQPWRLAFPVSRVRAFHAHDTVLGQTLVSESVRSPETGLWRLVTVFSLVAVC